MTRSTLAIATRAAKPPRAKPRHLEAVEQRLFVRRFRLDPRTRRLLACAIPNGGKRGIREAALLKAEGVERGVPDWILYAQGVSRGMGGSIVMHPGLALEFKSPTGLGRVSVDQLRWHEGLRRNDWRVAIVTSADSAWIVLCEYLQMTLGQRP